VRLHRVLGDVETVCDSLVAESLSH
jgi:hypothetical protein